MKNKVRELLPGGKTFTEALDSAITESSSLEKVQACSEWEDIFLGGSEVEGSCQRIDGNPSLNKCLLAYCLDGKNPMVAVKREDGNIYASPLFR